MQMPPTGKPKPDEKDVPAYLMPRDKKENALRYAGHKTQEKQNENALRYAGQKTQEKQNERCL